MRLLEFIKNLRARKVQEPSTEPWGSPGPGANLPEMEEWVAKVRKRNQGTESRRIRVGPDAQAERQAELAYLHFKTELHDLSGAAQSYFWLKLLWFIAWRAPHETIEKIEQENAKVNVPNKPGWRYAHTARPAWIRRPLGGDKFDRGETAERLDIPL